MKKFLITLLLISSLVTATAHADIQTYTGTDEYTVGEHETQADAKERSRQRAMRNAQEQAGVYIRSYSRSKDFELVEDEIITLTEGILKVVGAPIYKTVVLNDGKSTLIYTTVTVQIDTNDIDRRLKEFERRNSSNITSETSAPKIPNPPHPTKIETHEPGIQSEINAKKNVEHKNDEPYIYTSEDFKFTITCPFKPVAVIQNPWNEPEKCGEMLVFTNEGFDILYAYMIQVDAFDNKHVPDFNKGTKAVIGNYLLALKKNGGFAVANLVNITKDNKGVYAVTPDKIDVINEETGEVDGEFIADKQFVFTFFRTSKGRCISIQLITPDIHNERILDIYRRNVASFKEN